MSWLLALIQGLFSTWLGNKTSTAENLGKSEESFSSLQAEVNTLSEEAQAKADAPTNLAEVIALQKKGKI